MATEDTGITTCVSDWHALGRHVATAASDEQVAFLAGLSEMAPEQINYVGDDFEEVPVAVAVQVAAFLSTLGLTVWEAAGAGR